VTIGSDGYVWVANRNEGTVSRVDPSTEVVTHTVAVGGEPTDIEFEGNRMWMVDRGDPDGGVEGRIVLFDATSAADGALTEVTSADVGLNPLDLFIPPSDDITDGVWTAASGAPEYAFVRVDATP
jgi:YVTN family beta-propeller protein